MKSLVGLAHMTKTYDPDAIKKLAPVFSFLSTANPQSLSSIERAAGYAVPILQSGLEIDPVQSLLMGTALTRAGATSTKSGTWLRELALRAMPGTSLVSKTAFEKHETALKALGLVDDRGRPTWFTDGKPDLFKLTEIAGANAGKIPLTERAGIERQLFGAQGSGAFALLTDPAVRQQVQSLRGEMDSPEFRNRYASFMSDYAKQSPVQQFRTTLADFQNVLMDIGTTVLPSVTGALRDFKSALDSIRSILPGPSDGRSGDKWSVGTTAIEGAAAGAVVGSFFPGVGTVGGAALGGVTGAAMAAIHNFGVSAAGAGTQSSGAAENVNKLTGAITGLGAAAAGAGGVFPGGTSRAPEAKRMRFLQGPPQKDKPIQISMALDIDGRTLAQAISDQIDNLYGFPTGAPAADGSSRYFAGDHNFVDT
jgi:hypothetical protein